MIRSSFTLVIILLLPLKAFSVMPSETVHRIADAVGKIQIELAEGYSYTGSGFAVSSKHIITNSHVVMDGQMLFNPKISINLNGNTYHNLKLVSVSHKHDLALLEVNHFDEIKNYVNVLYKRQVEHAIKSLSQISSFGYPATDILTRITGVYLTSNFPLSHGFEFDALYVKGFHHGISGGPVFDDLGNFVGLNTVKNEDENLFACTGKPVMALVVPSKTVKTFLNDSLNYSGIENGNLYGKYITGMPFDEGLYFASGLKEKDR